MVEKKGPKLRTAYKIAPPYPLGKFPTDFINAIGRQIIYLLFTKSMPTLEGNEWEQIFAKAIGAEWKPSNIGLDDVVLANCAWGAKTVKSANPLTQKVVRLISGRNSPGYSYGTVVDISKRPPEVIGEEVLNIWNTRVEQQRAKYPHVRTVVLIKSSDLLTLTIFEMETVRYDPALYSWKWNKRGNLEGHKNGKHYFTWQPHGSQFTIVEEVPDTKISFTLRSPGKLDERTALKAIGFDNSWIEVTRKIKGRIVEGVHH